MPTHVPVTPGHRVAAAAQPQLLQCSERSEGACRCVITCANNVETSEVLEAADLRLQMQTPIGIQHLKEATQCQMVLESCA
jgi:hypothetical protein